MDLNSILGLLASGNNANKIGKQFNVDSGKVTQVITSALPTLIGAMQKNASTLTGANSLSDALLSHVGDASLDLSNGSLTDGSKILSHILGNNSNSFFSALANKTGVLKNKVIGILSAIAPMLLGLIGKRQQSTNTSPSGLVSLLGGLLGGGFSSKSQSSSNNGLGGLFGSAMSDRNNNGIPDIIEGFLK